MLATDPTDWCGQEASHSCVRDCFDRRCANNNTGVILKERGDLSMALTSYMKAIEHGPDKASRCVVPCVLPSIQTCGVQSISHENIAVVLTDIGSRFKIEQNLQGAIAKCERELSRRDCSVHSAMLAPQTRKRCTTTATTLQRTSIWCVRASSLVHMRLPLFRPRGDSVLLLKQGVVYSELGQFQDSLRHYERAVQCNPQYA